MLHIYIYIYNISRLRVKGIAPHSHELFAVISLVFGTTYRDKIQTVSAIQSDVSVVGLHYRYRGCCGIAIPQTSELLYYAKVGRVGIGNEM